MDSSAPPASNRARWGPAVASALSRCILAGNQDLDEEVGRPVDADGLASSRWASTRAAKCPESSARLERRDIQAELASWR